MSSKKILDGGFYIYVYGMRIHKEMAVSQEGNRILLQRFNITENKMKKTYLSFDKSKKVNAKIFLDEYKRVMSKSK